jgi:hypothetical protein
MRRVFDGGDGVIRGGMLDRSRDNGVFGPDDARLDDREVRLVCSCSSDVSNGGNSTAFDSILTTA